MTCCSTGTGKSLLLREIVTHLERAYAPGEVAVTAITGMASVIIRGSTVTSWAGVQTARDTKENLAKLVQNNGAWRRWRCAKVQVQPLQIVTAVLCSPLPS